jgi:tetratricopeptide (TPR) repeat protein
VANELARWQGAGLADLPHLMYGAAQQPIGFCLLKRAGFDPQQLAESLKGLEAQEKRPGRIGATIRAGEALRHAKEQALAWSHSKVTSGHLVLAAVATPTGWGKSYGTSIGIEAKSLRPVAESLPLMAEDPETSDPFAQLLELDWIDGDARAWLERKHIEHAIQNIEDLRSSVAMLMSSADGQGLSRYPDLGVILGGLTGDTFLTLQCYEKAQSVRPSSADSFRMSGALALAHRGEFEEARGIVGELLERVPSPDFYVSAAHLEYRAGRVDDARSYLVKASSAIGQEPKTTRQLAEILWHSIDGGFEHALQAIVDGPAKGANARFARGLAQIALAANRCMAGDSAATDKLYEVTKEYERFGMEGVVLEALVVLAESQNASGDERFGETKRRAVELATRLGRPVRVRRLMSF